MSDWVGVGLTAINLAVGIAALANGYPAGGVNLFLAGAGTVALIVEAQDRR